MSPLGEINMPLKKGFWTRNKPTFSNLKKQHSLHLILRPLNYSQLNGKLQNQHIFQLERDDGSVASEDNITYYCKGLFGSSEHNNNMMSKDFAEDIPQLFVAENKFLAAPCMKNEVWEAVSWIEYFGPDEFPVEFYQVF